ncbi:hypothetical protein ONZ45_g18559 [Pleurotus djamor]|nr:hypothetical protein ONZ45_g18559 [Pleurotus djamor]
MASLLPWCQSAGIWLDPRIKVHVSETGLRVLNKDSELPNSTTLAYVPKASVLSAKSCFIAESIPRNVKFQYGLSSQMMLALVVCSERRRGAKSLWSGYLESLPLMADMPLLWSNEADDAIEWLAGTEVEKEMYTFDGNGERIFLLDAIKEFYVGTAEPLLATLVVQPAVSFKDFLFAFSLVSSRAFVVDAYHGLSMVPIADAFNHSQDNHVHIETDFDVCATCGSLYECPHDGESSDISTSPSSPSPPSHGDSCYEMVTNAIVPPHSEIFNTYGESLSNAQLLARYGFLLDTNDNDCIKWSFDELEDALGVSLSHVRNVIEPATRSILSDSAFAEHCEESSLVWAEEASSSCLFCINGDGKVSLALWTALAVLSLGARPSSHLITLLNAQLRLEASALDNLPQDPRKLSAVARIATSVIALCTKRRKNMKKVSELPDGTDIGRLLDELPEGTTRKRLALTYVLTEISILECCRSAWEELLLSCCE